MSMRKNNVLKMFFAIVFVGILVLCYVNVSMAANYVQKTARCPRCNTLNNSYGYTETLVINNISVKEGKYCAGCKDVVPEGERHMYVYTEDQYFFLCKSSQCKNISVPDRVYTQEFANPISEHYINGVRDY